VTAVETRPPAAPATHRPGADRLAGTGRLARLALRTSRVRIGLWVAGVALTVYSSAASIKGLYPTEEDLRQLAEPLYDNAAVIALQGPTYAIDTLGGAVVFNIGAFGYALVGLMGMFLVGRHTRVDEEAGRTELLRATVVGRHAPIVAALGTATAALAVTGALVTASMLALGLPVAGSVAYGLAMTGFGVVMAATTAVTAQLSAHARTAYGLAGAVLGLSYLVRAVGDVGDGRLSWASPMGWAQQVRPYAGERWWPLALLLATAGLLAALALGLLDRRDLGSGMLAERPGPPRAARWLTRPWGLAVRLQRASVLWWAVGLAVTGVAYGSVGGDVEDLVGDSEGMAEIVAQAGGDLVDSYFSTALLMVAVVTAGFTVTSALRPRSEETAGRAEALLATALGRRAWLGSHLAVAAGGSAVVVGAGGLAMGLTDAVASGDGGQVWRLTGGALAHLPALWVLAGLGALLVGAAPRATGLAWALVAWCVVVAFFGELLDLPRWARDLSPFQHVPRLPADDVAWLPLGALAALAAALAGAGLAAVERRDVGS
jgi:ABC-2 type transport system permease protein